jgi:thiamine-phosphate pyrophosphorylase
LERAKSLGLFCIVSSHSISEASGFAERGADTVTLSPIFSSPGKGEPLGVETLEEAVKVLPIAVIALGGIVDGTTLETVRRSGAAGFASIRYFG